MPRRELQLRRRAAAVDSHGWALSAALSARAVDFHAVASLRRLARISPASAAATAVTGAPGVPGRRLLRASVATPAAIALIAAAAAAMATPAAASAAMAVRRNWALSRNCGRRLPWGLSGRLGLGFGFSLRLLRSGTPRRLRSGLTESLCAGRRNGVKQGCFVDLGFLNLLLCRRCGFLEVRGFFLQRSCRLSCQSSGLYQ